MDDQPQKPDHPNKPKTICLGSFFGIDLEANRCYMFAGSDAAGRRSATFYSFVATCLQHQVDPYAWLACVLPRIAATRKSDLVDLLPTSWKRAREQRAAA